ncbi:hypothetical protein VN97_g3016 [Penicillium thymicola]|uniref:Uncharacterized protein n=1 Tax=Penicillium thymicola TaxID=293382 RepID=A0AAI9TPG0_PENTH|nr:hypothetical protein VN97_g3016 [Penicillium thymicola]
MLYVTYFLCRAGLSCLSCRRFYEGAQSQGLSLLAPLRWIYFYNGFLRVPRKLCRHPSCQALIGGNPYGVHTGHIFS